MSVEQVPTSGSSRSALTVELVPKTCWASNVRSLLSQAEWSRIRKATVDVAAHLCEVCGDRADRIECHEVWDYDDVRHAQRLVRMIALCAACHEVKHIGRARVNGRGPIAMRHLMRVNAWTEREADEHVERARAVWRQRSEHQWSLNLDALGSFGVNVGTLTAAARPPARTDLYSGPREE